jgi:glyceraldehyde 3-phosphate dehydrogenase
MAKTKIGINGFGRIGRNVFRALMDHPELEVVAVNDLTDAGTLAHLFKYDSVHGRLEADVEVTDEGFAVNGRPVKVLAERDPANLPWGELGVDLVVESTGRFRKREDAAKHLQGGAKKVIISAPAKDEDVTIVMGVNEDSYDPANHHVISNASCTTNCLAPVVKVLHQNFGVRRGLMTTVHAYTNDQRILDLAGSNIRRSRAGAANIVPTTTGAAKAVGKVIPELNGRLNGNAIRVPVTDGSICDCTLLLKKEATVEEINDAMKKASEGELKGVLGYSTDEIVSSDILGRTEGSIFDSTLTMLIPAGDVTFVKVASWYDNEYSFTCQMMRLAKLYGEILTK